MYGKGKKSSKQKTLHQPEENIIKNIRNLFNLEKENKAIKDRIIIDIRALIINQ